MKKIVLTWSMTFILSMSTLCADAYKESMIRTLESIREIFHAAYAPAMWKKENDGWDIDKEYEKAKDHILQSQHLPLKEYQQLIKKFLYSAKDYHVNIMFYSTEEASLPFRVKTIGSRTFIDYVNFQKLPPHRYLLRAGDELLAFNGTPIQTVLESLRAQTRQANLATDQSLADLKLTERIGLMGDVVPKGLVTITSRSQKTGQIHTHQLMWNYHPEKIKNHDHMHAIAPLLAMPQLFETQTFSLFNPLYSHRSLKMSHEEDVIGAPVSFVPELGEVVWKYEGQFDSRSSDDLFANLFSNSDPIAWNAYIYLNKEGRKIGYVRIPHYVADEEDAEALGKILNFLDKTTEALVIDQVNNGGGHANFLYKVARMLTTKAMVTPKHRIKLTQEDVFLSYEQLERIKFDLLLAERGLREEVDSEQQLLFEKYFYEFLIEEWNQGRSFTQPIFLAGVDLIIPHPRYRYTKPVLMLINELDFSCADFLPAILQDNSQAVLFGTRTSGAGGYIKGTQLVNQFGILALTFTGSLAERDNMLKIESLGITPDIEYQLTVEDVQGGYQPYAEAVNVAVSSLLPAEEEFTILPIYGDKHSDESIDFSEFGE